MSSRVQLMAVQAQYVAHAFPHSHDPHARSIRPALGDAASASVFLDEPCDAHQLAAAVEQQQAAAVGGNTVFSDLRSGLTCNNNNNNHDRGCFVPRQRARIGDVVGAGMIMEVHHALLPPVPQAFTPAEDVQGRVLCSGAASTSGRPAAVAAPASHSILSHLYRHGVEIDAFIRIENEMLRAGLEEARRRHVQAVVSAMERAAARRLRAAESDLERALARNAELAEKLRQMGAEGQAWQGISSSHEAAAAGLRATIDELLQTPCAGAEDEGEAEDARSCCFEQERAADRGGWAAARACKACGEAGACVLLLPCRHLCLCGGCEASVDACPVCAATKNASFHVLLG